MNTKTQADNFDAELGRRLRELRLMKGISQQELGDPIGISFQQIQKYERGVNRIAVSRLFQLAKGLGCSPFAILQTHSAYHQAAVEMLHSPSLPTRDQVNLLRYFHGIVEDKHRKLVVDITRALGRVRDEVELSDKPLEV
jgi:transcriptional regulator with XRE-family HTH domain